MSLESKSNYMFEACVLLPNTNLQLHSIFRQFLGFTKCILLHHHLSGVWKAVFTSSARKYKPYGARHWQMSSLDMCWREQANTTASLPHNPSGSLKLDDLPGNPLLWPPWVPKAQESLLGCSHSNTELAGFSFRDL